MTTGMKGAAIAALAGDAVSSGQFARATLANW